MHATQARKGTQIPYISHLIAVSGIILEAGGTEDEAIAGLLHDGPEDQGGQQRLDDIRRRFGDQVADIVARCSDTFEVPKPPWKERKERYRERSRYADASTLLVSIANKLHNAGQTVSDLRQTADPATVWSKFSAPREDSILERRAAPGGLRGGHPGSATSALVARLRELIETMKTFC